MLFMISLYVYFAKFLYSINIISLFLISLRDNPMQIGMTLALKPTEFR